MGYKNFPANICLGSFIMVMVLFFCLFWKPSTRPFLKYIKVYLMKFNQFSKSFQILLDSDSASCPFMYSSQLYPQTWQVSNLDSLMAQWVKNLPAMQETQETWVWSLGQKDHLEEEMETHSSILAWRISWTEEPGGLLSMGSQSWTRLSDEHFFTYWVVLHHRWLVSPRGTSGNVPRHFWLPQPKGGREWVEARNTAKPCTGQNPW